MAVALEELYKEIEPIYDVRLLTKGCFRKIIEWTHVVENPEFIKLLHGGELVFTGSTHYTSEEWLLDFVEKLIKANAGGLVISVHKGENASPVVVEYCNKEHFPLIEADWDTPYLDIMRLFAEILLKNEQRETNLNTAFKDALYYPKNVNSYIPHFERHGFYRNMSYVVCVLSCNTYNTENGNDRLDDLAKKIRYSTTKILVAQEEDRLLILVAEQNYLFIKDEVEKLCNRDKGVYVGVGTEVSSLYRLHDSYECAMSAYQLTKTAIATNCLFYKELGIYKVLSNLKDPMLGELFVEEVLGELIRFDERKQTNYLELLKAFFENDCNILRTSQSIYCHKNTLNYKMNKIKDILNYDIMTNENRVRIMVALYLINMRSR